VFLIPASKIIPSTYKWWMRSRIYKWYGLIMTIERAMMSNPSPDDQAKLLLRFEAIEKTVTEMKTPASFGDQLYVLRDHVRLVRERLIAMARAREQAGQTPAPPVA
jgi:hypothetical protein